MTRSSKRLASDRAPRSRAGREPKEPKRGRVAEQALSVALNGGFLNVFERLRQQATCRTFALLESGMGAASTDGSFFRASSSRMRIDAKGASALVSHLRESTTLRRGAGTTTSFSSTRTCRAAERACVACGVVAYSGADAADGGNA